MTYQLHAAAVLGLLDADDGPPPLVVKDGFVPAGTAPPYVLVYFVIDSPEASADFGGTSDMNYTSRRVDCFAYCHSVGANAAAARAVAARVRNALLDVLPAVTGRLAFPIRLTESQPPVRDETTGSLVMDQVDVYRLSTIPVS
jgi:hypothetical protein